MGSSTQPLGPLEEVWDILGDVGGGNFTDWEKARCLIFNAAGTIDGIDRENNAFVGFPVIQGYNPVKFSRIDSMTGPTSVFAGR